jgi:hypothetical protein
MRKDKAEVLDMLFNAFTKHQFYNIKDLVKITQQPSVSFFFFLFRYTRISFYDHFRVFRVIDLFEGYTARDLQIQRERTAQERVGAQRRVQTERVEFGVEEEGSGGLFG